MPRGLTNRLFRLLEPRQYDRSSLFNSRYLTGIGGVVLDIGCGAFVTKYRFSPGTRYYGLDITSRATHVRGDAHCLPFQDQSVDWVLLVAMLEHVAEPQQVLHEAFRVLRPGGKAYVAVPFLQMEHGDTDFLRWTTDGVDRLIQASGFQMESKGVNGGFFTLMDYLLWHQFREAARKRDVSMALGALAMKVVAQPVSRLARDLDSPIYATSFHMLVTRPS